MNRRVYVVRSSVLSARVLVRASSPEHAITLSGLVGACEAICVV